MLVQLSVTNELDMLFKLPQISLECFYGVSGGRAISADTALNGGCEMPPCMDKKPIPIVQVVECAALTCQPNP